MKRIAVAMILGVVLFGFGKLYQRGIHGSQVVAEEGDDGDGDDGGDDSGA